MTVSKWFGPSFPGRGRSLLWGLLWCLVAAGCATSPRGDGEGPRRREREPRRQRPAAVAAFHSDAGAAQEEEEPLEESAQPEAAGKKDVAPAPPRRGRRGEVSLTANEALADLQETRSLDLSEAQYRARLGDEAYNQLDYRTAVEEYRKALDVNPALSEVRERWARASLVLGIRSGEVEAVQREFVEADRVRKQERLADVRRGLKEGGELLEAGDLENAERKFRKVFEELLWFEYPVDVTSLRREAKERIEETRRRKEELGRSRRSQQEELAHEESEKALSQEQKVRQQQIRELVRKAADYIRLKDYDKAIDACQRILELKPDHRVARFWLRDVKSQKLDQQRLQIYKEELENRKLARESLDESAVPYTDIFVFPGQKEWEMVRRRKEDLEVISLEDPEWVRKIKNDLEIGKLTFAFEQRPLTEVLGFLSDSTGITIFADPAIDTKEILIDLTAKEMKAADALSQILTLTGLAYTFKENTLYITEKDKAKGTVKFAIYNVSDILNKIRDFEGPAIELKSADDPGYGGGAGTGPGSVKFTGGAAEEAQPIDPTSLIELIKEGSGGEEAWGEMNTIEFHKGQLLVNATPELHRQIQLTLGNLRQDSDLFVVLEARFIDVQEEFLEDIGVDSRALGVGPNWGIPFGTVINNSETGGQDPGFVKQGSPVRDVTLIMGQDRTAGRIQHIVDGFTGLISGTNLGGGPGRVGGLTLQATWLEPFQINVILRAVQEESDVRQLTAPIITAHNGQRVYVSVITQRAYIADYELVSGGTGFTIVEVADPVVQTFQEGVILDVDPVITPDKKYITLDVRPTLASLIGGVISTIRISLGSFTNVAFQVPIGVPEIALQQSFTSVTVPNGGTVLLGGFKALSDQKFVSYLPLLGKIPLVKNLFRRKAQITEKRSLVILITARIVDLRQDERSRYND